jgi:cullin 1
VCESIKLKHNEELLIEVKKRWSNHLKFIKWMKNVFSYIDRSHVYHNGLPGLQFIGLNLFKKYIYEDIKMNLIH